jgi:hypothetical protein
VTEEGKDMKETGGREAKEKIKRRNWSKKSERAKKLIR